MTTTAVRAAAATTHGGGQFANTGQLLRLMVRRERLIVAITVVLFVATNVSTALTIVSSYGTPAERLVLQRGPGSNAAFRFLLGPLRNLQSDAAVTVWRAGLFMVAALAICAVLMVVRQTRKEEELGRTELLRAGGTGPLAPLAASAILTAGFCAVVAAGMSLMLIPFGGTAFSVVAVFVQYLTAGLAAVGAALVAAQFAGTSHIANLSASSVVLIGYLLRGVADATGGWGWLRWLSPMGWAELIDPFGADNLLPALASIALFIAGAAIAGWIALHRDLGSGVLQPRPGPAATTRLGSIESVAARLSGSLLWSWVGGIAVYALIVGFMQPSVNQLAAGNKMVNDVLRESGMAGELSVLFSMTMISFLAVATSAWPVNVAERLRTEESAGRTEMLLGTPLSRSRFYLAYCGIAALGVVVALLGTAVAMMLGTGIAGGGWAEPARHDLSSAAAQMPAALVVGSVALALYAVKPALAHVGWILVIGALLLGPLAGMFDLPRWARDISPFTHTPAVPAESIRWTPIVVLLCVAAVFTLIGWAAFGRRDIR